MVGASAIHGVPPQGVYPHQPPSITTRKQFSVDVKDNGVIPAEGTVTVNLYLNSAANQNPHVLVASQTLPFKLRPCHILRITLTPDWTHTPTTVPGSLEVESIATTELPVPTDPTTTSFTIDLGPRPPIFR